VKSTSTMVAVP